MFQSGKELAYLWVCSRIYSMLGSVPKECLIDLLSFLFMVFLAGVSGKILFLQEDSKQRSLKEMSKPFHAQY